MAKLVLLIALLLTACGGSAQNPEAPATCGAHTFLDLAINSPACDVGHPSCAFDNYGAQVSESSPDVVYRFACVGGKYAGHEVAPHPVEAPPTCDGRSLAELEAKPPACMWPDACAFDANGAQVALTSADAAAVFACVDGHFALLPPDPNGTP